MNRPDSLLVRIASPAYDAASGPPASLVFVAERDLTGMSTQVLYEFEMVAFLAWRLLELAIAFVPEAKRRYGTTDADLHRHWRERNAMLESLLIHVRQLAQFLFTGPTSDRPNDVHAVDFFADRADWWRTTRDKRPEPLSDDVLKAISKEVAHLTDDRAPFTSGGTKWSTYELYGVLATTMELFADNVPEANVCDDFRERVHAALPPRMPDPPSPRVPTSSLPPRGYSVGPSGDVTPKAAEES